MEWRGTQSAAYTEWVVMAGVAVAVAGAILLAVGGSGASLWSGLLCLAAGGVVVAAGIVFGRLALVLDRTGVHLSFGPWGFPRRDVPWSAVRGATLVDVRWLTWGGWGMRWRPGHGTAARAWLAAEPG